MIGYMTQVLQQGYRAKQCTLCDFCMFPVEGTYERAQSTSRRIPEDTFQALPARRCKGRMFRGCASVRDEASKVFLGVSCSGGDGGVRRRQDEEEEGERKKKSRQKEEVEDDKEEE